MINPILASSARRRMRTLRTPIVVTFYGLMIAILAWVRLAALNAPEIQLSTMRTGIDSYIIMLALQFFLTILITPAMTAGSIAGERERQTLDLLLVTNTGAFRIVWGMLLESFAFIALLIFSTLPMLCIVLISGGITVAQILTAVLFMIITAFAALSIGIFCSTIFQRTVTATVTAYIVVFAIGIGTILVLGLEFGSIMTRVDYDISAFAVMNQAELLRMLPKSLYINPGIGFICLLMEQTKVLEGTFQSLLSSGYWLYQIFEMLQPGIIAWINMGVMTVFSIVITCISALLVRPGKRVKVKKK